MTRILYLTPLAPLPATDGGRQRTNLLYHALAKLGSVSTLVINQTHHPITQDEREHLAAAFGLIDVLDAPRIGRRMPWAVLGGLGDKAAHLLRGWGIDYATDPAIQARVAPLLKTHDLVVSRYLWAPAVAGVVGGALPLIVDVDDRESEKVRSSMPADLSHWPRMKRWWWRRRVQQLARAEGALLSHAQHVWLTKEQDLQGLDGFSGWSVLPNIPFGDDGAPATDPPPGATQTLLFVGSLGFAPNRHGVQRFLDHSWPTVRAACPQARLVIVGGSAPQAWNALPGVQAVGFVDDLRPYYEQAGFSVVPLWEGAGTKIKVLESLQSSRTVVASAYAMRGYEAQLHDGQSVRVARDDAGMAQACIELLQDPQRAAALAREGQIRVQRHYSRPVFESLVGSSVQQALAGRASGA